MKFLNGWKTILGVLGTVGTVLVASGGHIGSIASTVVQLAGNVDSVLVGVFAALTTIGVIHKAEKASK